MRLAVLGIACLAWVAPTGAAETADRGSASIAEVTRLENSRRAAMITADTTALAALFAEDCTYIHSNGIEQSRSELLRMLARGEIRYLAFTVEAVKYRAHGAAVVGTGTQTIELANAGKPFTSRSRYTVVYAPAGEGLELVAYQSTTLPEVVMQEKKE
jgi:ketosteroid isomerase-like protein